MDVVTDNFGCLVLDNTSRSNKIEDCIFWYKAKYPIRECKVGSKELWEYHKKNYREKGSTDVTTIKKKSNIHVKKIKSTERQLKDN
jgi:hypothetical protein